MWSLAERAGALLEYLCVIGVGSDSLTGNHCDVHVVPLESLTCTASFQGPGEGGTSQLFIYLFSIFSS